MIATLTGVIGEKLLSEVVIDAQGVGYGVYATADDLAHLTSGETTKLYIYEYVREQAHDLYGFLNRDTKTLFEQLLNVTGVGPRMALSMLSIGSLTEVRQAIAAGDVKYLQAAVGVGRRVAERVVVELKDKVGLIGVDLEATGLLQAEETLMKDEAIEALVALGYSTGDAAKALQSVDQTLPIEERVKQALAKV